MIICFLIEEEIAELHFQHLTDTMAGASNFLKQHQGSQEHKPLISTHTYTRSSIIINKAPLTALLAEPLDRAGFSSYLNRHRLPLSSKSCQQ